MPGPTLPATFTSLQGDAAKPVPIRVRGDLDERTAFELAEAIGTVPWHDLVHAYGPAEDVPEQLIAAVVGDDATRKAAWWNLWGNIHHQGTIYEATVAAVPIIRRLASWTSYPDRVEAIFFLREVGQAEGVVVWTYDKDEDLAYDEARQRALTAEVSTRMREATTDLLAGWRSEPAEVRRALLWLLSAAPDLHDQFGNLVAEVLPTEHSRAWRILQQGPASQDEFDTVCEFEEWVHSARG